MVLGLVVMSEDTSLILILPLNVFTEWLHPLGWGQSIPGAGGSLGVQIPGNLWAFKRIVMNLNTQKSLQNQGSGKQCAVAKKRILTGISFVV